MSTLALPVIVWYTARMKFEFELDEIDTDNLFSIMNSNCMRAYARLVDTVRDPNVQPNPATVQCLIDQYRYSEELLNTVFNTEIIHMNLDHFDEFLIDTSTLTHAHNL